MDVMSNGFFSTFGTNNAKPVKVFSIWMKSSEPRNFSFVNFGCLRYVTAGKLMVHKITPDTFSPLCDSSHVYSTYSYILNVQVCIII